MKVSLAVFAVVVFGFGVSFIAYAQSSPPSAPQGHSSKDAEKPKPHVEFGPFLDYYRFDRPATPVNFLGVGARVGAYVNRYTSLEAEMAYDFEQTYSTSNNLVISRNQRRPIHGLFGPKLDFGTRNFDMFLTGKLGFVNFSSSTRDTTQWLPQRGI